MTHWVSHFSLNKVHRERGGEGRAGDNGSSACSHCWHKGGRGGGENEQVCSCPTSQHFNRSHSSRWQSVICLNRCVSPPTYPRGCLSSSLRTVCSQNSNTKWSRLFLLKTSSRLTRFTCFSCCKANRDYSLNKEKQWVLVSIILNIFFNKTYILFKPHTYLHTWNNFMETPINRHYNSTRSWWEEVCPCLWKSRGNVEENSRERERLGLC